jgi:hypothetical protein
MGQRRDGQDDGTEDDDGDERRTPAQMLTDECAERDAEGSGHRDPAEHHGDRLPHPCRLDDRGRHSERNAHQQAMRGTGQHASDEQGAEVRCRGGENVAGHVDAERSEQYTMPGRLDRRRGQQRSTDRDPQRV